jgi:hypothetical protein
MMPPLVPIHQTDLIVLGRIDHISHTNPVIQLSNQARAGHLRLCHLPQTDLHVWSARVDVGPLVKHIRNGPSIIAHNGRAMALPKRDHRILVVIGPLFPSYPWLDLRDLEEIAEQWYWERARWESLTKA